MFQVTLALWEKDLKRKYIKMSAAILYAFYVLSGNFTRLIRIPMIPRYIPVAEIVIVLFVGLCLIYFTYQALKIRKEGLKAFYEYFWSMEILLIVLFVSILINTVLFGFYTLPYLYYARLFSLIYFSFIAYLSLFYKKDIINVEAFYFYLGIFLCLIGWVIYFIQPDTWELNRFFESKGIFLNLDPHKFRLIGNIFDPNFFGNILLIFIGILYINLLTHKSNKKSDSIFLYIVLIFFEVSLLKTVSRSSFLGLFILILLNSLIIGLISITKKRNDILKRLLIIDFISIITIVSNRDFYRIIGRIKEIPNDGSAHARFQSWQDAFLHIRSSFLGLLFGDGYGFLNIKYKLQFIGFDSSFLNLILYCGFLGSIVFIFWFVKEILLSLRNLEHKSFQLKLHFINLCSLLLSFFIISWFNNLLFYQFWIVLFLPYYYFLINRVREEKR